MVNGFHYGGEQPKFKPSARVAVFLLFGLAAFTIMGFKLADMQIAKYHYYKTLASGLGIRKVELAPLRGIMYSIDGKPLVENVPSFGAAVVPAYLDQTPGAQARELGMLSRIIGVPYSELEKEISASKLGPYAPITVREGLTQAQAETLNEFLPDLPGVKLVESPLRRYLYPELLAPVLGYVGPISYSEYQRLKSKGYEPNSVIGQAGLEAGLEQYLRGYPGYETVEVNAAGKIIKVLNVKKPTPGDSVYLTINLAFQQAVYNYLLYGMSHALNFSGQPVTPTAAAAIVVNPNTGEIYAMASLPSYNDNLFETGITESEYAHLLSEPGSPLVNHAVGSEYPPGSTFKMVTATAALADGYISPSTIFDCPPEITLDGYTFHNWATWNMGYMTIADAIAASCDTFFYQVAERMGTSVPIAEMAYEYGFGQTSAIQLPGQVPGMVPDQDWTAKQWEEHGYAPQPWYLGNTLQMAIGQGYTLVTPLQVAMYVSAIANGGYLLKPTLVSKIVSPDGKTLLTWKPQIVRKIPVPQYVIDTVREGMYEDVVSPIGTGSQLRGKPYTAAGKTGTAQYGIEYAPGHYQEDAWYVAFAPYNHPQVAVVVVYQGGGEGFFTAEPIAVKILDWWWAHRLQISGQQ